MVHGTIGRERITVFNYHTPVTLLFFAEVNTSADKGNRETQVREASTSHIKCSLGGHDSSRIRSEGRMRRELGKCYDFMVA